MFELSLSLYIYVFLNKSTTTKVRWTKSADDRLLRIENRLENIEKRLEKILAKAKAPDKKASKTIIYTILRKK